MKYLPILFLLGISLYTRSQSESPSFDKVYQELKQGKNYSPDVKTGFLTWDRTLKNGVQLYALIFVPYNYTPEKKLPVRVVLHGAVSSLDPYNVHRFIDTTLSDYKSVEQIRIYPSAYFAANWYYSVQYYNVMHLLDSVKRIYNVDENRVSLSGFSDGATGAYAFANFNCTPFSCFLPYIGSCAGLTLLGNKQFYLNNLRNKPMFIENGKLDETFPPRIVEPYVQMIRYLNPNVTYFMLDSSGHDLKWLQSFKDTIDHFIVNHPRQSYPDHLIWQTENENEFNRNHWVIINHIGRTGSSSGELKDENTVLIADMPFQAFRRDSISAIIEVNRNGNAIEVKTLNVKEYTMLLSPEQFDFSQPVKVFTNGVLSYEGIPEKDTHTLLYWNAIDNDRTMLFASELKIKVGKK